MIEEKNLTIEARGRHRMWQFVLRQRDIRRNVCDGRRYERVNIAFLRSQLRIACNRKHQYFFFGLNSSVIDDELRLLELVCHIDRQRQSLTIYTIFVFI